MMEKPMRVQRCTTHFHACDCREWRFEQIRDAAIELLREVYDDLGEHNWKAADNLREAIGISIEDLRKGGEE